MSYELLSSAERNAVAALRIINLRQQHNAEAPLRFTFRPWHVWWVLYDSFFVKAQCNTCSTSYFVSAITQCNICSATYELVSGNGMSSACFTNNYPAVHIQCVLYESSHQLWYYSSAEAQCSSCSRNYYGEPPLIHPFGKPNPSPGRECFAPSHLFMRLCWWPLPLRQ